MNSVCMVASMIEVPFRNTFSFRPVKVLLFVGINFRGFYKMH